MGCTIGVVALVGLVLWFASCVKMMTTPVPLPDRRLAIAQVIECEEGVWTAKGAVGYRVCEVRIVDQGAVPYPEGHSESLAYPLKEGLTLDVHCCLVTPEVRQYWHGTLPDDIEAEIAGFGVSDAGGNDAGDYVVIAHPGGRTSAWWIVGGPPTQWKP